MKQQQFEVTNPIYFSFFFITKEKSYKKKSNSIERK
jgi:hypothetical protein